MNLMFQNVLNKSWRSLQNVLKASWRCLEDVFARHLEDVLKTSWKRLENVLKTYNQDVYVGLDQDVLNRSWRHLLKTYRLGEYFCLNKDVLKTSSEDEDKRRLQDVFIKTDICWDCVLIKSRILMSLALRHIHITV